MAEEKWQFQRAAIENGAVKTEEVELEMMLRKRCVYALERALECAKDAPLFSQNQVWSGYASEISHGRGHSIEYGLSRAIHAEAFLTAVRLYKDSLVDDKRAVLALVSGNFGEILVPGDSRDLLLDVAGGNIDLVFAAPGSNLATVIDFKEFWDYARLNLDDIYVRDLLDEGGVASADDVRCHHRDCVTEGRRMVNDKYAGETIPMRKYHAGIMTKESHYYGARDLSSDPIYALQSACHQLKRSRDSSVRYVIVTCEGDGAEPPHVLYRDRHHLIDALDQSRCDIPIYLFTHDDECEPIGLWRTTPSQWLPLAFGQANQLSLPS